MRFVSGVFQKTDGSESLFGDVIFSYTRAQAIADRALIRRYTTAVEAAFRSPTAVTVLDRREFRPRSRPAACYRKDPGTWSDDAGGA